MKLDRWLLTGIVGTQIIIPAQGTDDATSLDTLSQQPVELDQRVRILERKQELEKEAAAAQARTTPVVSVGEKGFSLESGGGGFRLRLRSLLQAGSRFYFNDGGVPNNDSFVIRRARVELTGQILEKFEYRLMEDFAGSSPTLLDAWLKWSIDPRFQLVAGKSKLPVGLEREQSREVNLLTEFGYPTSLVPNRDLGLAVRGQFLGGALDYYLGVFNGTGDGGSSVADTDDDKSVAARLFAQPFLASDNRALQGLGFGIGATYSNDEGTPTGYRTVGQQTLFNWRSSVVNDGTTWRVVPQLYYYNGPFGLIAEYAISSQEVQDGTTLQAIKNQAWNITASYVLTGEDATFRGVKPNKPVRFGGDGGWGAWQLVGRYTGLHIDQASFPIFANPATSASGASTVGGGLNWYLNTRIRFTIDYNHTTFDGLAKPAEHALFTRIQYRF